MSAETEEFKQKTAFLIPLVKGVAPKIFASLLTGGILKYVLATRGFDNMIIVGFVMILLTLRAKK